MKKELISVIIPYYDREEIVKRAIDSVMNQTYDNFEIVLVDDGSPNTTDNFLKYLKSNPKIHYYRYEKNQGPAHAKNYGLLKAKGEYIAFLDSDDEFLPDKLDKQISFMKKEKVDFSHTSYYAVGKNDKVLKETGKINNCIENKLIYNCGIATPTVMLKKSIVIDNDIFFNEKIRIGEDVCFYLELFKKCTMKGIDIPLSNVYVDDDSCSKNLDKQILGIKNIMQYILDDEYYRQFDFEIYNLFKTYENLLIENKTVEKVSIFKKIFNFFLRLLKKMFPRLHDSLRKKFKK